MNPTKNNKSVEEIDVRIWRSQIDNLDDVIRLMNKSHNFDISEDWLRQKLSWDQGGIAAIAYSGKMPVGLALLGYAPYIANCKPVAVMLSLDNFVIEQFRGRGIYRRLLSCLDEACEEEGMEMAITFPNSQSRPGFENAGWEPMAPMWGYVHIPLAWNIMTMWHRIAKVMRARGESFRVVRAEGISKTELELLSSWGSVESGHRFQFDSSVEGLRYRFNDLRGAGYSVIRGADCSAVVRRGFRGSLSEVQILATFPREISPSNSRDLLNLVNKKFGPDIISYISNKRQSWPVAISSGYIRAKKVTTPYFKARGKDIEKMDPVLSGIDLHLW